MRGCQACALSHYWPLNVLPNVLNNSAPEFRGSCSPYVAGMLRFILGIAVAGAGQTIVRPLCWSSIEKNCPNPSRR